MERKFLVFSCLVLLISIVYFIYTSYQLHIENRNRQEMTIESEVPVIGSGEANSSFHPLALEHSNPEWAEEESKMSEKTSENLELEETEVIFDTEKFEELETQNSEEPSSPELEPLFIDVKQLDDQRRKLNRESESFDREFGELSTRQLEILTEDLLETREEHIINQLHEEFERVTKRIEEIRPVINSFLEEHDQLNKEYEELEKQYGISMTEFHEKYEDMYKYWREDL